jgi:heme O synthase-like polyprenyltransferase
MMRPDPVETKVEQEQGRPRLSSRDVVHAYVALTKPRIIELLNTLALAAAKSPPTIVAITKPSFGTPWEARNITH